MRSSTGLKTGVRPSGPAPLTVKNNMPEEKEKFIDKRKRELTAEIDALVDGKKKDIEKENERHTREIERLEAERDLLIMQGDGLKK